MGQSIAAADFSASDYQRFADKLQVNLQALQQLLACADFGCGDTTIGAELELSIIDQQARPLGINRELQARVNDPQLTLELNRYNLEYNLKPLALQGKPFSYLRRQLSAMLASLNRAAAELGGRVVPIGILPTLRRSDFGPLRMTAEPRYQQLIRQLKAMHPGPFHIHIEGRDTLDIQADDVTLEGANTSLQLHLRVAPEEFCDLYNAIQLATPLVLAIAANSPGFLGRRLWAETRIPLFKQSTDSRDRHARWQPPVRVQFGHGWLRNGALELFREAVYLYPPLLPVCDEQDPLAVLVRGELPVLSELRLQQSSIWSWNRPVYDPSAGGHLRIEMRALPAGPSAVDMAANMALLIGLARALLPQLDQRLAALPFHYAKHNFYTAARDGMAARLLWPNARWGLQAYAVDELLGGLLDDAAAALQASGVDDSDVSAMFAVIEQRLRVKRNGALWQGAILDQLAAVGVQGWAAQQAMLERYVLEAASGQPVAQWSTQL